MKLKYVFAAAGTSFVIMAGIMTPLWGFAASPKAQDPAAELKGELDAFQKEVGALSDAVKDGATVSQDAIGRFRATIEGLRKKVGDLKPKIHGVASVSAPLASDFNKSIQRGSAGDDVVRLQELMKQFPDLYPRGTANGIFGPATEGAVKKLQEKLDLDQTGAVGPKTRGKLNELSRAVAHKKHPKIESVAPADIFVGAAVTLTGEGFTIDDNALFVRGKTVMAHISSDDGATLSFVVPPAIPCMPGSACPIKILNADGISNAKPVKFVEAPVPPPSPTPPPPPPAPTDTMPPARADGAPAGVLPSGTTQTTLALMTDEHAACRFAATAGVAYAAMTNAFTTPDGMNHVAAASGLRDGKSYLYFVRCQDDAGNANTDDFLISFSTAVPAPPVPEIVSMTPSVGGAGAQVTLAGKGFTATGNAINFGGTAGAVVNLPSADGKTIMFAVPGATPCQPVQSCAISVTNVNGTSNAISFFLTQPLAPVAVATPNGGERLIGGAPSTISWTGGKDRVDITLVTGDATLAADPSASLVGYLAAEAAPNGSLVWDARRACDRALSTCFDVAPGTYKILAVSEDVFGNLTMWDAAANQPGNSDVSDSAFTLLPSPSLAVVSPNGGEAYKYGDAVTIAWQATSIVSKSINIKLLKAGSPVATIASNVPQSIDTGLFLYNWTVSSALAVGSDYTIEISDAANAAVRDASDSAFRIASLAALHILAPNGGETTMRGFNVLVYWTYSGYTPSTIIINLYKAGSFYRMLATGVKPVNYIGYNYGFSTQTYPSGTRYVEAPIALDIPEGNDYAIEITDGTDTSIRAISAAPFSVVSIASPITFKGRLIDALSGAPVANAVFGGYTSNQNMDGTYYGLALPRLTTDANGQFSYATTTDDMVAVALSRGLLAAWPSCSDVFIGRLFRYTDLPRITVNPGYYSQVYPSLDAYKSRPLTTSVIDFGDIPLWPAAKYIMTFSDIPSAFYTYYQKPDGTIWGGGGNTRSTAEHIISSDPPLEVDTRVQFVDSAGKQYVSPFTKLSSAARCQIATLSFMDGTFQWEPYPVGFWLTSSSATIGTVYSGSLKAYASTTPYYYGTGNQGVAPFVWGLTYGSLPPGLAFDAPTGTVSGIPTTAGTYNFGARVTDANGVRAARDLTIIVK